MCMYVGLPSVDKLCKKKIQALLFVTLETLDSYADISTLISEIKKSSLVNYNSIINHNTSLLITFYSFDK